jgi:DNA-binding transcriptional MerR regulator
MRSEDDPEIPADPGVDATVRLSLNELANLTAVSPRTIRFYMQQGLVSRPEGAKRGAHYVRRHVEQLLMIRRWTEAGVSLDRIRELIAGAPDESPPQRVRPGTVEVWSRLSLADGLEVHLEPARAGLSPEQVRTFVRDITAAYRRVRTPGAPAADDGDH